MSNNVTEFKKIANSRGLLMALGILCRHLVFVVRKIDFKNFGLLCCEVF